MAEAAARQSCPNCGVGHDVSVYVTGQRVRCVCGLHFEVRRVDVRPTPPPSARVGARGSEPTAMRPSAPGPAPAPPAPRPQTRPDRPATPSPSLPPTAVCKPLEVPGFELLELLGRGGMGEVWKARQASLGRTVAVKILAPELAADPEFVQRFEKEAAALAALSHPNIVQIIERGAEAGARTPFFAMEYCDGRSLRELVGPGAPSLAERLRLVAQIGEAVDYAHRRGVIHRDLKPENILVDAAGAPKLLDFGLAGLRGPAAGENLTRAATAMGTLHYMAPEQRRDARSVDERADVYSLGVILYELLVGEVPVGRFKLPSERLPELDPRVDKVVAKALEPDPEARYPSAAAMVAELLAVASAPPTEPAFPGEAAAPAPPASASASASRQRIARLVLALALVGVGALVGVQLLGPEGLSARRGRPPRTAMPGDTLADLRVSAARGQGEDYLELKVGFAPGEQVLRAGTGEWELDGGALLARVYGGGEAGAARPFAVLETPALLAQGAEIVATLAVLDAPPPARYRPVEPPAAELQLRGESGGKLGLAVRYGPKAGYWLTYRPPGGETVIEHRSLADGDELPEAPVLDRPLRVRLSAIRRGLVEVYVGDGPEPLFTRRVDLSGFAGRVALGCVEATCRFAALEVVGRPADVAHPPPASDPRP